MVDKFAHAVSTQPLAHKNPVRAIGRRRRLRRITYGVTTFAPYTRL
jgi:hypothetical protein